MKVLSLGEEEDRYHFLSFSPLFWSWSQATKQTQDFREHSVCSLFSADPVAGSKFLADSRAVKINSLGKAGRREGDWWLQRKK